MTRATDIEQRASEWIIRSESGDFTDGMRADLERWLLEPRNRITFLRIKEAWRRASRMRSARPLDGNVDPDLLKHADLTFRTPHSNKRSGWPFWVAAAAGLTLILYLAGFAAWIALAPTEWIKYTTSIGGYEHVTLADGSGIQLNTDSEIRTRLTARRREIQLIRGEALINVVNDSRRPFTVSAASVAVRAEPVNEATVEFVVRVHAAGAVDVSVTRGKVVLEPADGFIDVAFRRNPATRSTLEEGEAAAIRPEGIHLTKVGREELNRKLPPVNKLNLLKDLTIISYSIGGRLTGDQTDVLYRLAQLLRIQPEFIDRVLGSAASALATRICLAIVVMIRRACFSPSAADQ